ncbi:MAG TPA: twin-arginine translocase TatA/TatE family subunit [Steroidobacteraceae bacterium]|jgi:sec-independent protein translocase protein TatB
MMRAPAARARQRGFFDFSFPELVITFGVALVVLGPKKLPGLVQQLGRWVGRARHMARQFREQLEQEVNSINAVKPVTRNVAPDVGPPAPGTEPAPDPQASAAASEASVAAENTTAPPEPEAAPVEPAGSEMHPEAQIYFAMNGSEPAVLAQDPYALPAEAADPHGTMDMFPTSEPNGPAGPRETQGGPGSDAKSAEPDQPATVEVVFPHDHG